MSFDTYTNLQAEILAKLVRANDSDAQTRVASWITLAEDELRLAANRLMLRQGETTDSAFSIAAEFTALPSGFYRPREIIITSVNPYVQLTYVPPQVANQWDLSAPANTPRFWTIQNNQLRVFPVPNTTYTARFTYYALPSLSGGSPTNWLLTAHPKVYYKASLAEAYDYYDDVEARLAAEIDRDRLFNAAYTSDGSDQMGTAMRMRVQGGTP